MAAFINYLSAKQGLGNPKKKTSQWEVFKFFKLPAFLFFFLSG